MGDLPPPATAGGRWASNLARGDLGTSTIFNTPVADVIASRCRTSLVLMAAAWVLSGIITFGLGIAAAVYRGTRLDRSIRWLAYTFASASVPSRSPSDSVPPIWRYPRSP